MLKTLYTLLLSFGKIGFISLGGGNAMLKLIEYEAITAQHWISNAEFVQMVGTSVFFPGLTALKLSALIGYKTAGFWGMLTALLALNLPGLILALVSYQWITSHNTPVMQKVMVAVQYGALALLAAATFSIGQGVVGVSFSWGLALSALIFFIALTALNISPFWGLVVYIGIGYFLVK